MPQSLSKVYIHGIFSTKYRKPLLDDSWRDEMFNILGGSANNIDCQSLTVGGVEDHVHMLFQLGRTISVATALNKIKTASSTWANQTHYLNAPFHWQSGYAAFSVSQSNVEAVKNYILNQREHHTKQTFQDELREWLTRYQMTWDERYIWD